MTKPPDPYAAQSEAEWTDTLDEVVRVLAPGGLLLVSNFAPGTGPLERPLAALAGARGLHEGFHGDVMVLLDADALDADFAARGLVPEVESATVERVAEDRKRVTVNALYRKGA